MINKLSSFFFGVKDYPAFWIQYESKFLKKNLTKGATTRFVAFDTETTGLNANSKLLSIGAVAIQEDTIYLEDSFEKFVRDDYHENGKKSIPIHGIIPGGFADGELKEIIPSFIDYIGNAVLIGHHVDFDVFMIQESLKKLGIKKRLKNNRIDTARMAIRLDYGRTAGIIEKGKYTLDALSNRFAIPMHDRHNAAGDAFITAQLFLKLKKMLRNKGVVDLLKI